MVTRQAFVELSQIGMAFPFSNGRGTEVLRSFSLFAEQGRVLAIVGPSGCGKTTILKLIAALIEPSAGQVSVAGVPALEARRQRLVSFMFQRPVLLPWLTVRENVRLPGRIIGDPSATGLADSLIEVVGLEGFEDAYPGQLSGGMQSRVALARALSYQPRLLLLDEPFASLDAMTRSIMHDEVLRVLSGSSMTAVLVTHSIDEAVYLADRVVVLSERPARVLLDVPVSLPRPRTWKSQETRTFLECRARIQAVVFRERGVNGSTAQAQS